MIASASIFAPRGPFTDLTPKAHRQRYAARHIDYGIDLGVIASTMCQHGLRETGVRWHFPPARPMAEGNNA